MDHEHVLDAMFGAAERGDWAAWRAAFAEDAVLARNISPDIAIDDAENMMRAMSAKGTSVRYENVRRLFGPHNATEMHDVVFSLADGRTVRLDVCVVVQFDTDGKIARADEYLDSAAASALRG